MEKQHLTYFKIENFKRFDSFEMSNLGQFNLIVGDNNVGKTSVLEALTLETNRIELVTKLILSFLFRNNILTDNIIEKYVTQKQFWSQIFKNINEKLVLLYEHNSKEKELSSLELIENTRLTNEDKNSIREQIPIVVQPELWLRYYSDNRYIGTFGAYFSEYIKVSNSEDFFYGLLRMNVEYNDNHLNAYYKNINPYKERRNLLVKGLSLFLKHLEEVRPHKIFDKELLGIVLSNDEKIHSITQFGDGVIIMARIILGILSCQNGRIMIDEIDAGIHFSKMKLYWKNIIKLCVTAHVQLFATTHSLECQQAFIDALEDPEMQQYQKDARNISLVENKQGEVKAVTYDFEQFEYALDIGFNTRGGAR